VAAGSTYTPIATTTLGSTATSITFSSIGSYTDLRLVLVAQDSTGGGNNLFMQFNGDTGANYSQTNIVGNGSIAYSGRNTSASFIRVATAGLPASPAWSTYAAELMSYKGTTYKTALISVSEDISVSRKVALWSSTNAITSLYLYMPGGSFSIGTTATIYGIAAA
jgi:hypothetical protein